MTEILGLAAGAVVQAVVVLLAVLQAEAHLLLVKAMLVVVLQVVLVAVVVVLVPLVAQRQVQPLEMVALVLLLQSQVQQ